LPAGPAPIGPLCLLKTIYPQSRVEVWPLKTLCGRRLESLIHHYLCCLKQPAAYSNISFLCCLLFPDNVLLYRTQEGDVVKLNVETQERVVLVENRKFVSIRLYLFPKLYEKVIWYLNIVRTV
jgi:hypothetical protein